MHRHYVGRETLERARVELPRAESRHLATVLRLKRGDKVRLFDGLGGDRVFEVASSGRDAFVLESAGELVRHAPPRCRVTLGACVSKGRRMDWTVGKAVELGASEIVPITSEFSVVRADGPAEAAAKRERWMRIAIDAARQSDAAFLPVISPPLPFDEALARIIRADVVIAGALLPEARPLREVMAGLRAKPPPATAAWMTGPEGDFSPREYRALREAGVSLATLGGQVLRAETAAMYGLCVLGAEWL